jgi:hypothetical protein
MAAPSISQVVDALRNDLAEVASELNFVITASSIHARLGGMLNWAVLDASAKALAQQSWAWRRIAIASSGVYT